MKCIIDIPDDKVCDYVGSTHLLMPYTIGGHKGHHDTGLKLTLYTEPDRKAIEDEVWEFAKKSDLRGLTLTKKPKPDTKNGRSRRMMRSNKR